MHISAFSFPKTQNSLQSRSPEAKSKTTVINIDSGEWDFKSGVSKDYKKNEQIVFVRTQTSHKRTIQNTFNGEVTNTSVDTYSYDYSIGSEIDENERYTIITSEKDNLILNADDLATGNSGSKTTISIEYTLKK